MKKENYGFNVKIKYKDGTEEVRNNVTEIHFNYPSPLKIKSIAFESDIHGTGGTIQTERIEEFEAILADKKEDNY